MHVIIITWCFVNIVDNDIAVFVVFLGIVFSIAISVVACAVHRCAGSGGVVLVEVALVL